MRAPGIAALHWLCWLGTLSKQVHAQGQAAQSVLGDRLEESSIFDRGDNLVNLTGSVSCVCADGESRGHCCSALRVTISNGDAFVVGTSTCNCENGTTSIGCCGSLNFTVPLVPISLTGVRTCLCPDGTVKPCSQCHHTMSFIPPDGTFDHLDDLFNRTQPSSDEQPPLPRDDRVDATGAQKVGAAAEVPAVEAAPESLKSFDIAFNSPNGNLITARACLCAGGIITTKCPCFGTEGIESKNVLKSEL